MVTFLAVFSNEIYSHIGCSVPLNIDKLVSTFTPCNPTHKHFHTTTMTTLPKSSTTVYHLIVTLFSINTHILKM